MIGRFTRSPPIRTLLATAALSTAACDPGASGPDTSGDLTVLQASDVRLLGTSDVIALAEDLEVLPDGSVWVLNSVEPLLVRIGAGGAVLESYGRVGGGPEEFGIPSGFVEGGIDGGVWVIDTQRLVLREVAGEGRASGVIRLPRESLPPGSVFGTIPFKLLVRTARLGDHVLVPRRSGDLDVPFRGIWLSIWTSDIVAVDVGRSTARDVLALGTVLGDPTPHFSVEGSGLPFPFWYRLWAVCSDEIRVLDRLRNAIRRFDAQGIEREALALPPVSLTEVSPRDFARAIFDVPAAERMGSVPSGGILMSPADSARLLNEFVPSLTAGRSELANLLPRYVDLRCDSEGTQWIQPFDIDAPGPAFGGLRGGRIWLRTTPDGRTDRVRLPDRFDPYRFTSDRIWGVQRDELDVATVAWIEVP